ncbi:hypothetical protein O7A70_06490 [Mesorhizobium sp. Cs1299R1N1]|uniref:hypothetical protein n=1 Tax=unclassified Mesorhizobium TaxID=325217 RepID=UPI00301BECC3
MENQITRKSDNLVALIDQHELIEVKAVVHPGIPIRIWQHIEEKGLGARDCHA